MIRKNNFIFFVILLTFCLSSACMAVPSGQIVNSGGSSSGAEFRTETYENGDQYTGQFVNGKYNGKGTYTWANGDVYEGEFMDGQAGGTGRLTFFGNGQYWEGQFVQGMISDGSGVFYWGSDGDKFDGQWINGKPDGTGILLHADGTSNKVTYKDGVFVEQSGSTAGGNSWTGGSQSQYGGGSGAYVFSNLRVGDTVSFGRYEQDNNYDNGSESVLWQVLDIQNGKALLLSLYGLDTMAYHWDDTSVTWENSSLRAYLNSNFYNGVFDNSERQSIAQTWIANKSSAAYGTFGGNDTFDNVFLLSIDEVLYYFPNEGMRKASPTPLARAHGAYGSADVNCAWWWLRSPGQKSDCASSINSIGVLLDTGPTVSDVTGMFRPAVWVNLAN